MEASDDPPPGRLLVDWKFSVYRYSNAERCFKATMEMRIHLYERKSQIAGVAAEMERAFTALEELKVVLRRTQRGGPENVSRCHTTE